MSLFDDLSKGYWFVIM